MKHEVVTLSMLAWLWSGCAAAQSARMLVPAPRALGAETDLTASASLSDVDGDGDLDILFAEGRHWPQQNRIFMNNGRGLFNTARRLGDELATSYAIRTADFDGDGDLDVVVGNDRVRKPIFWNDGAGRFSIGPMVGPDHANTRNITVADLNGDGRPDILVVNRSEPNTIHLNQGGEFAEGRPIGSGDDATIQIIAADLDDDGDLDLALANRERQPNVVYWNDGKGTFTASSGYGTGRDRTRAVAAADFDGDGQIDLATGNISEPNGVFFNRPEGFVAGPTFGRSTDATFTLTATDLDLDGDMDLLAGNANADNAAYYNDGTGVFVEERFGRSGHESFWDWKTFDIDRDMARGVDIAGYINATPDLAEFRARDGKLLLYHGWSDGNIVPHNTIHYYEEVLDRMGGDQDGWLRLFMAPGMAHCSGGDGPDQINWLGALERWHESDQAPDRIIAHRVNDDRVDMTRPLCPYPQVAQWTGVGSTNDAENFSCEAR